jgi:hypothetical protein
MAMQDTFKCLTAVAGNMKAVCYLHRIRCSAAGTIGIVAGAIATYKFGRFVLLEPRTQAISRPVGQQVHHFTGGNVHQHGAEPMTTAQREIIDAKDFRCRNGWRRQRSDQSDQGHAAHGDGVAAGKPCAGTTPDGQPDILQQAQ